MKKTKFKSITIIIWLLKTIAVIITAMVLHVLDVHIFKNSSVSIQLFILAGILILIDLFSALITSKLISKPIDKVQNFIKKIAKKEWSEPLTVKGETEIGQMFSTINDLQETLKKSDESEREFFNNISHDLKTPTMVIMSHAEAILDGIYIDSLENTAQIIKDESFRLNKKINHLVYLSSLEYILENKSKASAIQLDEVLDKIVGKFEIASEHLERNKNIEQIQVIGDFDDLTIAFENIWDNAIRYAKSKVSMSLKKADNVARLEIFNDGEHISPKKIDGLFKNMYKGKMENFGLGLSITKKTITFYGGNVWAENVPNGGVRFIVEYPI